MIKDRSADLVAAQTDCEDKELKMTDIMEKQRNFLTRFFVRVEKIWEMIDKIQTNVEEVKIKHSTILSQPHTDKKIQMELESLMPNIETTADKVREELQYIGVDMVELNMEPKIYMIESTLLRMHEIQLSTLFRKFFHVMMEYLRTQTDYMDLCKDRIQQQLQITGRTTTDEELEEMLEKGNPAVFAQGIVTDTKQAKQTLAITEARHIIKLQNSIREVYNIFGGMTERETVDRIEDFVNHSVYSTENMKEPNGIHRAARRKKIMMLICLTVVGLILVSTIAGYLGLK